MGSQSTAGSANANETNIEGCLSGSAGNYTLVDKSGTTWQLSGDTSKLDKEVGHEVRITGSASGASSASGSSASSSAAPSGAGSSSSQTFNVSKVKKIANTCSSSPSGSNPSK